MYFMSVQIEENGEKNCSLFNLAYSSLNNK